MKPNEIQVNSPSMLPTVDAHLLLIIKGEDDPVPGVRREYIHDSTKDEPGYRDMRGNRVPVDAITGWYYQSTEGHKQ